MLTVIIGGSGSGKSAFAEMRAVSLRKNGKRLYYLATMQRYGTETQEKIERHKEVREGKDFLTLEQPVRIEEAADKIEYGSTVLLECLSNLAANEFFEGEHKERLEDTKEAVLSGIMQLYRRAEHLIIVTNNIFEDGIAYETSTVQYMKLLGLLNMELVCRADEVTEVVAGIPVLMKGEK